LTRRNSKKTTDGKPSTAFIDWGLVAAIIAIVQATAFSINSFAAGWPNETSMRQFYFGFGALIGVLAVAGASWELLKKLKGNEPKPRVVKILLLAFILISLVLPLAEVFFPKPLALPSS
jgi:cytochrome b561